MRQSSHENELAAHSVFRHLISNGVRQQEVDSPSTQARPAAAACFAACHGLLTSQTFFANVFVGAPRVASKSSPAALPHCPCTARTHLSPGWIGSERSRI